MELRCGVESVVLCGVDVLQACCVLCVVSVGSVDGVLEVCQECCNRHGACAMRMRTSSCSAQGNTHLIVTSSGLIGAAAAALQNDLGWWHGPWLRWHGSLLALGLGHGHLLVRCLGLRLALGLGPIVETDSSLWPCRCGFWTGTHIALVVWVHWLRSALARYFFFNPKPIFLNNG